MMASSHFSDVTLVCEGRKKIRAHRSILCASSPVFRDLLEMEHTSNQHPIIYLRGVQFSEMEAILQFIYQGETVFHKKKINELLSVARNLEIKDLTESTMEMETDELNSNIMDNTENVEVSGEEHDKDNIEEFEDQFQGDDIEVADQEDDIEVEDQGDDIEDEDQGVEVEEFYCTFIIKS